jgi:hypothetical protein
MYCLNLLSYQDKLFTMLSNTTTLYTGTATCFRPSTQHFKTRWNAVHIYLPYGFTLWHPTSLQHLSQYEIVKSGCIVADNCKIVVGLGKIYTDTIKILNCMIKLLNNACMCKN